MLKRRDVPAHRITRPPEERRNDIGVTYGEVDSGAEVLLDPPLVKEREVVLWRVDSGVDERDVEGVPLRSELAQSRVMILPTRDAVDTTYIGELGKRPLHNTKAHR